MISAKEFRIGNRVQMCVPMSSPNDWFETRIEAADFNGIELGYKMCKGIPLTPEILEKWCDFEKTYAENTYKKMFNRHSLHSIVITLNKEGNILTICDEYTGKEQLTVLIGPVAQYLHSIQNVWFALTGKELEIKK